MTRSGLAIAGAFEPDVSKWDAWRPAEVARRLAGVRAPWYVAAGWAIDLFLGEERREHEDLEIAVPRDRFGEVAEALAGFELFVAGGPAPGFVWPLEEAGDTLETSHQTWVREPGVKAKHADRSKDEADFAAVVPLLAPARRSWLARTLGLVHPGHAWLAEL